MRIAFVEHSIELKSWPDKKQMVSFLSHCEAGQLLLGENPEQEIEFHSAIVYLDHSESDKFGIGICSEGHGLTPCLLLQPEISVLVFGFNSEVVGIQVPSGEIRFTLPLDSLFYSFMPLYDQNILLVQHEIGLIALTQNGQKIWKFSRDIITNIVIERDQLYLEFMDDSPVRLYVADGKIITP